MTETRSPTSLRIGDLVLRCRTDLGLDQRAFAALLGNVTQGQVGKWERGKVGTPRADSLRRLSEVCGVSIGALLSSTAYAPAPGDVTPDLAHATDPALRDLLEIAAGLPRLKLKALLTVARAMRDS